MTIFLWVIQIFLALHTFIGAVWKFSNSEQDIPSLEAIPHGVWMVMSVIEILCSLVLLLPVITRFRKPLGSFSPLAALVIAAEMLLFCGLHLFSDDPNKGPMMYWLVTGFVCAFLAYGRKKLNPL